VRFLIGRIEEVVGCGGVVVIVPRRMKCSHHLTLDIGLASEQAALFDRLVKQLQLLLAAGVAY